MQALGDFQLGQVVSDLLRQPITALPETLFVRRAHSAYEGLIERGLIEDPATVVIGGVVALVLGVIPTSFTRKTRNGKLMSRKINAIFWAYESQQRGEIVTERVEFRVLKLIKAFKGGFTDALK
jgi:hypothetical protein